jgi:hypothetical protein
MPRYEYSFDDDRPTALDFWTSAIDIALGGLLIAMAVLAIYVFCNWNSFDVATQWNP